MITQYCRLCNSPLAYDVSYIDDRGVIWAAREGQAFIDIPVGYEDKHPVITACYCPHCGILYRQ